jgi:hypothetical protein
LDVRINEVHSQVQTVDSKSLLDPRVMQQIVKACLKALKEEQARHKELSGERRLSPDTSADDN